MTIYTHIYTYLYIIMVIFNFCTHPGCEASPGRQLVSPLGGGLCCPHFLFLVSPRECLSRGDLVLLGSAGDGSGPAEAPGPLHRTMSRRCVCI